MQRSRHCSPIWSKRQGESGSWTRMVFCIEIRCIMALWKGGPGCGQLEEEPDDQGALMEAGGLPPMVNHVDCSGLIPEREGMPPLYQQQTKEGSITWRFWSIITITTNTMLIIIIKIVMSKMQFLLHIHKKEDLFLLRTQAEVAFNTTNSPRFDSSGIHLSPIILGFWGLLGVVSSSITE